MNEERQTSRPVVERLNRRVPDRWSGVTTGPGWDGLLDRLDKDLSAIAAGWRLLQAKSKFGLRVCYEPGRDVRQDQQEAMYALVAAADWQAATICETCANDGSLTNVGGWYAVRCPRHDAEARRRPERLNPAPE